MTWTSLEQRFAGLPLILAGSLVRRVEPRRVTVWLALKEACVVTLRVYSGYSAGELVEQCAGVQATIRLGPHLHLGAVTASVGDDEQPLVWGQLYYYDLFFQRSGEAESQSHLSTPGALTAQPEGADPVRLLVYPGQPLPGFVLPPKDINRLRVIHGSCRKPHGAGKEMLYALDGMIADAMQNGDERPQQLYLTGNQIYADDVATPLLFTLLDAGNVLFAGQAELLPIVEQSADNLPPSQRRDVVRNLAALTTTTPQQDT